MIDKNTLRIVVCDKYTPTQHNCDFEARTCITDSGETKELSDEVITRVQTRPLVEALYTAYGFNAHIQGFADAEWRLKKEDVLGDRDVTLQLLIAETDATLDDATFAALRDTLVALGAVVWRSNKGLRVIWLQRAPISFMDEAAWNAYRTYYESAVIEWLREKTGYEFDAACKEPNRLQRLANVTAPGKVMYPEIFGYASLTAFPGPAFDDWLTTYVPPTPEQVMLEPITPEVRAKHGSWAEQRFNERLTQLEAEVLTTENELHSWIFKNVAHLAAYAQWFAPEMTREQCRARLDTLTHNCQARPVGEGSTRRGPSVFNDELWKAFKHGLHRFDPPAPPVERIDDTLYRLNRLLAARNERMQKLALSRFNAELSKFAKPSDKNYGKELQTFKKQLTAAAPTERSMLVQVAYARMGIQAAARPIDADFFTTELATAVTPAEHEVGMLVFKTYAASAAAKPKPLAANIAVQEQLEKLGATFDPINNKKSGEPTGMIAWSENPKNLPALLEHLFPKKITFERVHKCVIIEDLIEPGKKVVFNVDSEKTTHVADVVQQVYDRTGPALLPNMPGKWNLDRDQGYLIQKVAYVAMQHSFSLYEELITPHKMQDDELLDTWLIKAMGAEDTPMNRLRSRRFAIAIVARQQKPGCKFDSMLVLECKRGSGKSTVAKILSLWSYFQEFGITTFSEDAPDWSNEQKLGELIHGKIVCEVPEMQSKNTGMSREQLKAGMAKISDNFRPPYARGKAQPHDRTCVFIGTTEESDWHEDAKNGRRFWPVKCNGTEHDLEERLAWFEANVLQLHGAALWAHDAGERYWFDPKEIGANEAEVMERLNTSEHELFNDALYRYLSTLVSGKRNRFYVTDIMEHVARNKRAGAQLNKQLHEYFTETCKWAFTKSSGKKRFITPERWYESYKPSEEQSAIERLDSLAAEVRGMLAEDGAN